MLDDANVIANRDPQNALGVAAAEPSQLSQSLILQNAPEPTEFANVVVAGMGGSALAAGLAKSWLQLGVPFEVVRKYDLPRYVGPNTLVIASSHSGNTEETLEAFQEALACGAKVAVVASGGKLAESARAKQLPHVLIAADLEPRMAVFSNLKALAILLEAYGLVNSRVDDLEGVAGWLEDEVRNWLPSVPTGQNYAKQLAQEIVGKTPVVYAGAKMGALAYKWKIGFNENAKNVAFANELPEFNHNEFIGWTSHPIEKPFAVIDLVSRFEHPRVLKRFDISDRLLSGMRPKAKRVELQGNTELEQMLWGAILGDFVSIYVALLNGVNPTPVDLIEKLKVELVKE